MSKKVVLRPTESSTHRRQPLLQQSKSMSRTGTRLGEAVGGTAAVCCCCPCGLATIVYLAIYKVPASLCQRALKKTKQRRRRRHLSTSSAEGLFPARRCTCGFCDDVSAKVYPCGGFDDVAAGLKVGGLGVEEEEDKELMELEKEMWERFYSTGFWRSPSQREDSSFSSSSSQSQSAPNLQVLAL